MIRIKRSKPELIESVPVLENQKIFQRESNELIKQLHPIDSFTFKITKDNEAIGSIWLTYDENFGYWDFLYIEVNFAHQRQGVAREAILQLLEFMIDELGRTKCFARLDIGNSAIQSVLRSVGFFNSQRKEETFIIFEKQL